MVQRCTFEPRHVTRHVKPDNAGRMSWSVVYLLAGSGLRLDKQIILSFVLFRALCSVVW